MISPAIKPRIAFKPISRGLIVAARNSVNKVQESTQKISKGLNKNEKFAMNYVQFFGSKKTTKILKKNLKSIKESLMSTFAMAKTLKKNVGGMAKGGFLGGALGILGKGLLGGLLGKLALVTLIGIATGGIGYLLYNKSKEFFQFLNEKKEQLAPIVNQLIQSYLEKVGLPTGVPELISEVDSKVDAGIISELDKDPTLSRDEAITKSVTTQIDNIEAQINELKTKRAELNFFDIAKRAQINSAISRFESTQEYLRSGDKYRSTKFFGNDPLAKFLFNRFLGGTPIPRGYNDMTTNQRTSTVVNFVENSPKSLETLEYEILRSTKLAGRVSAGEAKTRFYEDVLNYIKAKKGGDKNYKVLPEKFNIGDTKKGNIEEFNSRFGDIFNYKPSKNKQSNVSIIQNGGSDNKRGNGVNKNNLISSAPPDSGMINLPFYSPLDSDLAMERGAAKNLYNVYMG